MEGKKSPGKELRHQNKVSRGKERGGIYREGEGEDEREREKARERERERGRERERDREREGGQRREKGD